MPITPKSFDNIKLGYISETDGYIQNVSIADAKDYAELVENKVAARDIINDIAEEYDSTVAMLLSIVESQALLSENKKLSISLDRRKPYLDPLNYIQVMLIKKHRNLSEKSEDIFDMLLRTIHAIAIGMRNTG